MKILTQKPFCDFLTIKQTHKDKVLPILSSGHFSMTNPDGSIEYQNYKFQSISGKFKSNLQIRSDGNTVEFSGNVSRFNRRDNYIGLDLDECKIAVNLLLVSLGLPPFDHGTTWLDKKGDPVYTGAQFVRIDYTENYKTGSARNLQIYLKHISGLTHKTLKKSLHHNSVYFGKDNQIKQRIFVAYDKGMETKNKIRTASGDNKLHLTRLSQQLINDGILRLETRLYTRFLKRNDLRRWESATHSKLESQFLKDIQFMKTKIEAIDLDDLTNHEIATYFMWMNGIDPKTRLAKNTFYKHRKVLLNYGLDISDQCPSQFKPPIRTIVLSVAEVPDWYEQTHKLELIK